MNNPFISEFLTLKEIPEINGYGVFTTKDIEPNTVVEISPLFTYPTSLINIAIYAAVAEGVKESDIGLDQYAITWIDLETGKTKAAIMFGYLSMYNHSNDNNSMFYSDYTKRLMSVKTLRKINAGDQLTVSYGPHWFQHKKDYINFVEF